MSHDEKSIESAVKRAVRAEYAGESLWGFDRLLFRAAADIDEALAAWRRRQTESEVEAIAIAITSLRRVALPDQVECRVPYEWDPAGDLRARDVLPHLSRPERADLASALESIEQSQPELRATIFDALDQLVGLAATEVAELGWPSKAQETREGDLVEGLIQAAAPAVRDAAIAASSRVDPGVTLGERLAATAGALEISPGSIHAGRPVSATEAPCVELMVEVYATALRLATDRAKSAEGSRRWLASEDIEWESEPDEIAALATRVAIARVLDAKVPLRSRTRLEGLSFLDWVLRDAERGARTNYTPPIVHDTRPRGEAPPAQTSLDEAKKARAAAKRERRQQKKRDGGTS